MEDVQRKNGFQKILAVLTDRMLFSAIYIVTALIWSFPLVSPFVDIPMKIVFVWGILLIAYDFFTKRTMFTAPGSLWLALTGAAYLVSIALHPNRLYEGVKHFAYNGILIYILYCYAADRTEDRYKKWLTVLGDIIIGVLFAASAVSFALFALNFSLHLERGHMIFDLGLAYNRYSGLYNTANNAAVLAIFSVGLSGVTYTLDPRHFRRFRWFYIANAVVQFLIYSMTLSHGGALMLLVGGVCWAVLFLYPRFLKKRKAVVAALLSAVCLAGAVCAVQLATVGARKVLPLLPKAVASARGDRITDDPILSDGPNTGDGDVEFDRVDEDKGLTNGRLSIWKAGLQLWRQSPVFGAVTAMIYPEDEVLEGVDQNRLINGHLHNGLLQILVYAGAVGLLLFLIFAVSIIRKYVTALVRLCRAPCYPLLAAVFSVVAMLASQNLSQAHLLYNRQDPMAILFWFYLGFAMFSVRDKIAPGESRNLFMCSTPYQLQNAVRLAKEKGSCDVYISRDFNNADAITENTAKSGIFGQTVAFRAFRAYPSVLQKAVTVFRITFPEWNLRRHSLGKWRLHPYDAVYVSCCGCFSDSVRLLNPRAECVLYDDGAGSYFRSDMEQSRRSGLFRLINERLLNGRLSYHFDTIYLNRPEFSASDLYKKVERIPEYAACADELKRIFSYRPNDFYRRNRCVYLTQPLKETAVGDRAAATDREILDLLRGRAAVRVHPRQNADDYAGYEKDPYNNLWELECGEQIGDGHVLIGAFSTAQFTPKLLFGKEPNVIFTYRLYGWVTEEITGSVERLRGIYAHPERITVAETPEDILRALEGFDAGERRAD